MPQRTVVITGASDGIGAAAARALVARGDHVVVVGRSPTKTAAVARALGTPHHVADFARLDEVRALVATLVGRYPRIDVLVNNAGGLMGPFERTVDGFERTLQVNHLAPFLLTHGLLDPLLAAGGRVVTTSSAAARLFAQLDPDDLEHTRGYSPRTAYGSSKLANILFTRELHRRYHARGLATASFHPGIVATGFAAETTDPMRVLYRTPLRRLFMVSPAKGADTLVWLATAQPGRDWRSGGYYARRRPAATSGAAHDDRLAAALWERSARMVGVPVG